MTPLPQTFNGKSFVHAWEYTVENEPIGYAVRYENRDGDKEVIPFLKHAHDNWKPGAPPEPRPLFGVDKLNKDRAVIIVEGEKAAQALHYMGLQAVTSLGGCNATDKSDWNPLSAYKKIYLLPDNDEAGRAYMKHVARLLNRDDLVVVELPDLPKKGDAVDWIQDRIEFDGYHDNSAIKALRSEFENAITDNSKLISSDWVSSEDQLFPEINPLNTSLPPVKPFDYQLLPDGIEAWVKDIAERTQCPPDFIAITVMVALASVIGRKASIHPKENDDWLVVLNLWGALIGRPSAMKSPAMAEGLRLLKRLAVRANEKYKNDMVEYEVDQIIAEQKADECKQAVKKAAKSKSKITIKEARDAAIKLKKEADKPTVEHRYIVNDTTIEKLGELLNQNPNGLLLERDELTGWLKSLDREDRSNDRAFYMECFSGTSSYTYDRIGRGTIHIESTTVSIIGGIQPSKLRPYVWNAINQGAGDDGLIQRFQLAVYPDDTGEWRNVDRWPDGEAKRVAFEIFERLDALQPLSTDEEGRIKGVRFDESGQLVFNQWRDELERKVREPGIHPAIEAHLTKYRSLMPSIALILNVIEIGHGKPVTGQSAKKAVAWCDYLESHMHRIYGGAVNPSVQAAEMILTRRDKLPDGFTQRQVQRKGWAGLSDGKLVKAAVDELVADGYLRESRVATKGRPLLSYSWNPAI